MLRQVHNPENYYPNVFVEWEPADPHRCAEAWLRISAETQTHRYAARHCFNRATLTPEDAKDWENAMYWIRAKIETAAKLGTTEDENWEPLREAIAEMIGVPAGSLHWRK